MLDRWKRSLLRWSGAGYPALLNYPAGIRQNNRSGLTLLLRWSYGCLVFTLILLLHILLAPQSGHLEVLLVAAGYTARLSGTGPGHFDTKSTVMSRWSTKSKSWEIDSFLIPGMHMCIIMSLIFSSHLTTLASMCCRGELWPPVLISVVVAVVVVVDSPPPFNNLATVSGVICVP